MLSILKAALCRCYLIIYQIKVFQKNSTGLLSLSGYMR